MYEPTIELLLAELRSEDPERRDRATEQLWQRWFCQKGAYGLDQLKMAQALINVELFDRAEEVLSQMIRDQPDFAEARNRRAVVYYIQRRYRKSLDDCRSVLELVPYHFGALHGLGLCHMALGEYREAIYWFREALTVQPFGQANQVLLLECTAKLS
jgi:tetratricopeptide (TPR) repeat protein